MIGYTSYMEYNKETKRGSISYSVEEKDKRQKEILLLNYSTFIFNNDKNLKFHYNDKEISSDHAMRLIRENSKYLDGDLIEKYNGFPFVRKKLNM